MATTVDVDDRDPRIVYESPGEPWTVHTNTEPLFQLYQSSDTFTGIQGATATFEFDGTGIEYWGNRGPYHGPCGVRIDGQDFGQVNSNAPADNTPIQLFSKLDLQLGSHTIVITVLNSGGTVQNPSVCEIDRFVVHRQAPDTSSSSSVDNGGNTSTAVGGNNNGGNNNGGNNNGGNNGGGNNGNGGSNNSNSSSNTNSSTKKSPNWAAIGGGVGGGVAMVLVFLAFWLYTRQNRRKAKLEEAIARTPLPPDVQRKAREAREAAAAKLQSEKSGYGAGGGGGHLQQPSHLANYPHSINPPSTVSAPSNYAPSSFGSPHNSMLPATPTSAVPLLAHQQQQYQPPTTPNQSHHHSIQSSVSRPGSYYPNQPMIPEGQGYYDPAQQGYAQPVQQQHGYSDPYQNQQQPLMQQPYQPQLPPQQQYPQQHYPQQQPYVHQDMGQAATGTVPVWATGDNSPGISPSPDHTAFSPPKDNSGPPPSQYPAEKAVYSGMGRSLSATPGAGSSSGGAMPNPGASSDAAPPPSYIDAYSRQ